MSKNKEDWQKDLWNDLKKDSVYYGTASTSKDFKPKKPRFPRPDPINYILFAICMLIMFSGVLLGLVFGEAKFERVCTEAFINIMTGEYKK